jgi:hypothetical protein
VNGLSYFHGWNKIYLCYGLIFFLLGVFGCLSGGALMLNSRGVRVRELATKWRAYLTGAPEVAGPATAVFSEQKNEVIKFLYPERLQRDYGGWLAQLQKRLTTQLGGAQIITIVLKTGSSEWFPGEAEKYLDGPLVGLDLFSLGLNRWQNRLWLSGASGLPPGWLEHILTTLPEGTAISFKLRRAPGFLVEVTWEANEPVGVALASVIAMLAEIVPESDGPVLQ